jgi:hypothetical protein
MNIWGRVREFAMPDEPAPGKELTAQAVICVVLGLVMIAWAFIWDYQAPNFFGAAMGAIVIGKGIYDFAR